MHYLPLVYLGFNGSRSCNCSDESPLLNCGQKLKFGEMHSGQLGNTTSPSSPSSAITTAPTPTMYRPNNHVETYSPITCINKDNIEPLLNYEITLIIGSNMSSMLKGNYHLYDHIRNGYDDDIANADNDYDKEVDFSNSDYYHDNENNNYSKKEDFKRERYNNNNYHEWPSLNSSKNILLIDMNNDYNDEIKVQVAYVKGNFH